MEAQELHRGRLIDHIQLVVRDLEAAQKFYTAIFEILGFPWEARGRATFGLMNSLFQRRTVRPPWVS